MVYSPGSSWTLNLEETGQRSSSLNDGRRCCGAAHSAVCPSFALPTQPLGVPDAKDGNDEAARRLLWDMVAPWLSR